MNTIGGATTTALNNILQGKNDSILFGGAVSGAGSVFSYGIGKGMETAIGSSLRPTINNSSGWADVGKWAGPSGWYLFMPNSLPTIGASVGGAVGGEYGNAELNNVINRAGATK